MTLEQVQLALFDVARLAESRGLVKAPLIDFHVFDSGAGEESAVAAEVQFDLSTDPDLVEAVIFRWFVHARPADPAAAEEERGEDAQPEGEGKAD